MTGFKMGSAKKMKTGLGSKPGIFGSATTDEPESATAVPASATALPRRALSSGLPGPSESLLPLVGMQCTGAGLTTAMIATGISAAQAQAVAVAQAAVQNANLGAGVSGFGAGGTPLQMNVQAAVQAAVQQAAALLTAGGISAPGGGLRMNAVGRVDHASLGLGSQAPAGAGGASSSGGAPEPSPEPSPAHDGEVGALRGPPRRGDYTFCRKYTRSRVRQVPECEPLRSIDVYENLGMVGKGAFNKIYKARHRETGEVVALKSMQLETVGSSDGIPLEMIREMSIMMSIRHPNIVQVKEAVVDAGSMHMVMELVDFDLGLLIEHMKQPFSEGQVKCLAMQLLSALAAVHENFILHRDLKQTNLLLDKNGVLKLCDFGLARRCSGFGKPCTPTVTSLWYRAPEILLGDKVYGTAVDLWSFGCIFAEWLQHGEPLFQCRAEQEQAGTIFKLLGTPSEHSWPGFPTLPAVQMQTAPLPENFTMTLNSDGNLIKMPKNGLRKKFPAEGYTPAALSLNQHRTTALSEVGFELLNSCLTSDPGQRRTALHALESSWFTCEPLPVPLSRAEIKQLRRNRDEAINSGAHAVALAQQKAQANAAQAQASAAAIAASIKAKLGF